ncbi:hypothetical protein [Falsirhodobacter algicola]|uniref:Uncharacterized protein n=1 Tax=Falsirhodobacter algicola TaxID=2692330 RepID=A0A8J8SKA7_9RHOB|nr:hypothetical protein [Falsirhodobacter algicola]QUS35204.1 hypothetical protein GR316_02285 [Falsirhodobacter algicola]
MAGRMFSGFVCGAVLGVAALVMLSQLLPLPPGPPPEVRSAAPSGGSVPGRSDAPRLPAPEDAP